MEELGLRSSHWTPGPKGLGITPISSREVLVQFRRKSTLRRYTVSPLHANLQVANFQRCKCASGSSREPDPVPPTSGVSETAARPLPPVSDDPSSLPSPPSPSSSQERLPVHSLPAPYASCCTVLLYFSRYCTLRSKMFSLFSVCLLFTHYLCETY